MVTWATSSTAHKDMGITLKQIQLNHPDPDSLTAMLTALKVDHLAHVVQGESGLRFVLETPKARSCWTNRRKANQMNGQSPYPYR